MSSKTITAKNNHSPTSTHDHREITASDIPQADGSNKRGLDVAWSNAPRDAFGRIRMSGTDQRLDVEFLYDKQTDYFDEITNNGTVTYNGNTRDLTLSLANANNGSYAEMASYPVPYTPGNSQLIDITGVLDLADLGADVEVFLRSSITGSVVEQTISQTDWIDSVSDVDWSKSHIFSIDFQSLKVGRIQYFMIREGEAVKVAEILNDNLRDSGFWQVPNLPVSYKLYTDSGMTYMEIAYGNDENGVGFRAKIAATASATMKAICCTVKSEGGGDIRNFPGLARSVDNNITPISVSTTLVPILSIRPKALFQTYDNLMIISPKGFGLQTDEAIKIVIIHDAVLTGASWTDVDTTESCIEYDVSSTAVSNGHVVYSDYIYATSSGPAASRITSKVEGILGKTVLWNKKGTQTGVFTIAAIRTGSSDASVLSSLQWEELR